MTDTTLRALIREGLPAKFVVEDDEGRYTMNLTCTGLAGAEATFSPTHWLGESHHILERYISELGVHLGNPEFGGLDSEEWTADWITAVVAKLSGDIWAIWKRELARADTN